MDGYTTQELATTLARETVYRFLSALLRHPAERLAEIRSEVSLDALQEATEILNEDVALDSIPLGFGELSTEEFDPRELTAFLKGPPDNLLAEYDRVFGIGPTVDCPPYETEFCANQEPFYRAQQMADVAGFYHAFGLEVAHSWPDRPDHISLELEFMSLLATKHRLAMRSRRRHAKGRIEVCRMAERCFLGDHLAWWVPSFATGLRRKAGAGPYAEVGKLLSAFLPLERSRFNIKAPQAPVRPRSVERSDEESSCNSCSLATA